MGFKKILVALDGSESSLIACRMASQLCQAIPGEEFLHLLHCTSPIPNLIGGEQRRQLIRANEKSAEYAFEKAKKVLEETGNTCQTYTKEGDAASLIADTAKELGCDVIVMGCRGLGKMQSMLVGSVSRKVTQLTDIPILLAMQRGKF